LAVNANDPTISAVAAKVIVSFFKRPSSSYVPNAKWAKSAAARRQRALARRVPLHPGG
jgi:hypothetical protein